MINQQQFNSEVYGYILNNAITNTLKEIPVLDSSVDYWLVRAKGGAFYTDFNINGYVGIGWNEISLEDIYKANNSTETLKNTLREKLVTSETTTIEDNEFQEIALFDNFISADEDIDAKTERQYGTWAGQLLRFVNKLKVNDIVVVPSERSEFLLVGRITGDIYELTDVQIAEQEKTSNYKKSDFKKRWPISWFGYFDRNDADSKLYKMIYAQSTLSSINDYKPFINRAIFPYYLQDGNLFLSMHVSQPNDIDSEYLGQFIYQYSLLNKLIYSESKVVSKVNVQSEGVIELINNVAQYGLGAFTILAIVLVAPYGGEMKFLGQTLKIPGLFKGHQENKSTKLENEKKKLENDNKELEKIEKAVKLAEELKVPISELGIKLPQKLVDSLEKNIKNEIEKKSQSTPSKNEEDQDTKN
ncbi:hypothetical protein JNUCC83_05510 [Vagococcus sp. JNUCC 83]